MNAFPMRCADHRGLPRSTLEKTTATRDRPISCQSTTPNSDHTETADDGPGRESAVEFRLLHGRTRTSVEMDRLLLSFVARADTGSSDGAAEGVCHEEQQHCR